jgi:hypothetical protein
MQAHLQKKYFKKMNYEVFNTKGMFENKFYKLFL